MAMHVRQSEGCYINMDETNRELNPHGTADFPVACYIENIGRGKGRYVPEHWHDDLEILTVIEGEVAIEVDGACENLYAGDAAFFNRRVLHMIVGSPRATIASAVFSPVIVAGMPDSIYSHRYVGPILSEDAPAYVMFRADEDPLVSAQLRVGIEAVQAEEDGYEFAMRNALSWCVYAIWTKMGKPVGFKNAVEVTAEAGRLNLMCMFVKEHLGERFTVADIAASAKVSERECLRMFKKSLGVSPTKYVLSYRLSRAALLLACEDTSIAAISKETGFATPGYFAKQFKDEYGCTPSEYREKMADSGVNVRAVEQGFPLNMEPAPSSLGNADDMDVSDKLGHAVDAGPALIGRAAKPHKPADELGSAFPRYGSTDDTIG